MNFFASLPKSAVPLRSKLALYALAVVLASCGGGGSDQTQDARPAKLSIESQPADQSVVEGEPASFSVTAVGSGTLSYQWRQNDVPLPDANASTYTLPAAAGVDDGSTYSVLVSDEQTTIASVAAQLSVTGTPIAPSIVVPPGDQIALDGVIVTFSITADGTAPLAYAWQRNGVLMPDQATATLTLQVSQADHGSKFKVVVSNRQGSITSPEAMLSVTAAPAAPTIVAHPASSAAVAPTPATFSASATGAAPLAYQWRRNGSNITGANASTYTTPPTTTADSGSVYTVVVSNAAGSATSNLATLTVNAAPIAPAITTQPANQSVTEGQTASFSAAASGTAPLTLQWRRNGSNITGANASTYTTPPTTTADSGSVYTVVVSNAAGSATSNLATLTVNAAPIAPAITTQPANQSVTEGQTASFSAAASGTAPLTLQWRRNGSNITGANASTYTTPVTTASADNGAQYDVVVSNVAGSATTQPATLTVTEPMSYLAGLVASIPEGGWVKASTNSFKDAWPTGVDLPPPTPSGPSAVIDAWSGFAWDSRRSQLILWGGGHANYVGNEVYVWRGSDGRWTRGSLPSRVDLATALVVGNGAPQSSHTYQTNSFAPLVDRFVVFGGAAWNSGGPPADANGRTGAWWWDPNKADPGRVGGQDGTGWDPADLGNSAWQMRPDFPWVAQPNTGDPSFLYGTSAYHEEGGRDVIYVTMDSNSSGWPSLYRYQMGTPTTPDLFQRVGAPSGMSVMSGGAADIDTRNGLFVRTALANSFAPGDLAVWRLANSNSTNPILNVDVGVQLVDENGVPVDMNLASSIAYDSVNDQLVIWDSRDRGTVWITRTSFNLDGSIAPVWVARRAPSITAAQPLGLHGDGVLGKWKYVRELEAFIALDANSQTGDIWLYKPPTR